MTEPDPPEDVPLPRGLRPSRVPLALVVGGLVLCSLGSLWLLLRPLEPADLASLPKAANVAMFEQEAPEWLDDATHDRLEGGRGERKAGRHSFQIDEEGAMGVSDPVQAAATAVAPAPGSERTAERERAANMGIVGNLAMPRSARAPATASAAPDTLGHDPMSALGALTGDQVGANFGFGGLGLRGTGRGGAGHAAEGSIGLGTIGTIGHGAGGGVGSGYGQGAGGVDRHVEATPEAEATPKEAASSEADPATRLDLSLLQAMLSPGRRDSVRAAQLAPTAADLLAQARGHVLPAAAATPAITGPADAFFARYASLEGIATQPAHGYWQNTYVPGDAELRMLQARLASYDRDDLLPDDADDAPLDVGVSPSARPFDPPSQGALSAYVSASERGVTGPRRMLVQVGLQATPRFSGQRPALNLAIVLDLRDGVDPEVGGQLRALLAAFVAARDVSDRFRLYAAGPGGGLVVATDAFRSGPVTVALQRLLGERDGPAAALNDVVDAALQDLQCADDPTAPLGSSGLVLIHASAPGDELNDLAARLHRGALEGVPSSVFSVGGRIGDKALTRLALAGQGNRRLIASSDDAERAVDQELSAVARVVARAVRLRIRLAPGVQLVSVLGSRRLDELHAEQVRQAEQRIDQRVSRALGIAADRGEDEEGIQIVIPSFYAGDSHLILLDVVVPGAGPLLELSVRYKDLIQLENAVLRESLALANQDLARGPLQQQVLESLLAHELATQLDVAGRRVASGQASQAAQQLEELGALLDDARRQLPGLVADRQFDADRRLVRDYLRLLPELVAPAQREFLSDSLRFASLMKSQPRPGRDGTGVEP